MRKLIAAGIIGIISLVPVILCSPTAEAQVTDSVPSGVCKIDGTWKFTESRAHSPVRVQDFVPDGLILDITGPRAQQDPTTVSPAGGKVAGYVAVTPTLLADVDIASLDFVQSVGSAKPGYQLVVDRTPSDPDDGYDGILVGEPSAYGDIWWASKPSRWVDGPENITVPTNTNVDGTLADFAGFDPDAKVVAVGFSLGTLGVGTEARGVLKTLTFNDSVWNFSLCTPTETTTSTSPATTTTTTTSTTSSTTAATTTPVTTTSTTSTTSVESSTSATTSTTQPAVVPVGSTSGLANTGTSGIGTYLGIAGFLIALGLGSFTWLRVQRKRSS